MTVVISITEVSVLAPINTDTRNLPDREDFLGEKKIIELRVNTTIGVVGRAFWVEGKKK